MNGKPNLEQILKLWSKKDLWNRIQEKNNQILDLEAKLESKEKEVEEVKEWWACQYKANIERKDQTIEGWKTMYESVMQTCNNDAKEIERLREQLAEKEKALANAVVFPKLEKDNAYKGAWYLYFLDDAGNISYQHFYASKKEAVNELEKRCSYAKQPTQDKILFAVEQLEKVKEFCEKWKHYTENINYVIVEEKNGIRCNPTLYEEIDNQIKAIKEGK